MPWLRLSPPDSWQARLELRGHLPDRARTTTAGIDRFVSAYFVHGEIGYTLDHPWKPRLAVQYDQASGNRQGSSTLNRFDTLFGARRWEHGPTSLYGAVQRANLISPGLHLDVVPTGARTAFSPIVRCSSKAAPMPSR